MVPLTKEAQVNSRDKTPSAAHSPRGTGRAASLGSDGVSTTDDGRNEAVASKGRVPGWQEPVDRRERSNECGLCLHDRQTARSQDTRRLASVLCPEVSAFPAIAISVERMSTADDRESNSNRRLNGLPNPDGWFCPDMAPGTDLMIIKAGLVRPRRGTHRLVASALTSSAKSPTLEPTTRRADPSTRSPSHPAEVCS
jgi:hypothetical protein